LIVARSAVRHLTLRDLILAFKAHHAPSTGFSSGEYGASLSSVEPGNLSIISSPCAWHGALSIITTISADCLPELTRRVIKSLSQPLNCKCLKYHSDAQS
jgi:hypothetical protein